ncbi:MAG: tetratricopeptide repeat protein [Solirubrobacteraceae bacterium]
MHHSTPASPANSTSTSSASFAPPGAPCLARREPTSDGARRSAGWRLPLAHEADLATSLNNLSVRLGEAGRCEQALAPVEEAVTMRRRLAATDPAAHEPILATALNNLSNRLGDFGRHEQALEAIEEDVTIRRLLAASSAGYEPDLATLLQVSRSAWRSPPTRGS